MLIFGVRGQRYMLCEMMVGPITVRDNFQEDFGHERRFHWLVSIIRVNRLTQLCATQ